MCKDSLGKRFYLPCLLVLVQGEEGSGSQALVIDAAEGISGRPVGSYHSKFLPTPSTRSLAAESTRVDMCHLLDHPFSTHLMSSVTLEKMWFEFKGTFLAHHG